MTKDKWQRESWATLPQQFNGCFLVSFVYAMTDSMVTESSFLYFKSIYPWQYFINKLPAKLSFSFTAASVRKLYQTSRSDIWRVYCLCMRLYDGALPISTWWWWFRTLIMSNVSCLFTSFPFSKYFSPQIGSQVMNTWRQPRGITGSRLMSIFHFLFVVLNSNWYDVLFCKMFDW